MNNPSHALASPFSSLSNPFGFLGYLLLWGSCLPLQGGYVALDIKCYPLGVSVLWEQEQALGVLNLRQGEELEPLKDFLQERLKERINLSSVQHGVAVKLEEVNGRAVSWWVLKKNNKEGLGAIASQDGLSEQGDSPDSSTLDFFSLHQRNLERRRLEEGKEQVGFLNSEAFLVESLGEFSRQFGGRSPGAIFFEEQEQYPDDQEAYFCLAACWSRYLGGGVVTERYTALADIRLSFKQAQQALDQQIGLSEKLVAEEDPSITWSIMNFPDGVENSPQWIRLATQRAKEGVEPPESWETKIWQLKERGEALLSVDSQDGTRLANACTESLEHPFDGKLVDEEGNKIQTDSLYILLSEPGEEKGVRVLAPSQKGWFSTPYLVFFLGVALLLGIAFSEEGALEDQSGPDEDDAGEDDAGEDEPLRPSGERAEGEDLVL